MHWVVTFILHKLDLSTLRNCFESILVEFYFQTSVQANSGPA